MLQLFESKMLIRQFLAMLEKDERERNGKSTMEALHRVERKQGQVEQGFYLFMHLLSAKSTALAKLPLGSPAPPATEG